MEVINRFKGLDPIDRVPNKLLTEVHDIVQETRIKTIPMEKKCKKKKKLNVRDIQKQNYNFFVPGIMHGSIIDLVSQCFLCDNNFKNF